MINYPQRIITRSIDDLSLILSKRNTSSNYSLIDLWAPTGTWNTGKFVIFDNLIYVSTIDSNTGILPYTGEFQSLILGSLTPNTGQWQIA